METVFWLFSVKKMTTTKILFDWLSQIIYSYVVSCCVISYVNIES
jgi:hypothetical protein